MKRHAPFLALILLNVLAVFGPCLVTDPTTSIWAWPRTDYVGEAWLQWEMARQLAGFDLTVTSPMVDHPTGKVLTEHFQDYGVAALGAPLTWIFGALGGFNLASVLHHLAFGLSFYGLGWQVIGDRWGALASSLLASHATVLFVMLWWGEAPLQSAWLLPLTWWALVWGARAIDRKPVQVGLVLGGLLGAAGWLASYYLYFNALTIAVWGLWLKPWRRWKPVLIGGATWVAATVVVYLPRLLAVPVKDSTLGAGTKQTLDVLNPASPFKLPLTWSWTTSLDAGGLFSPVWSMRQFHADAASAEGAVYLGWVLLLAGLVGLVRKLPYRGFFVTVGLMGLVLSLGPYLRYGNNALQIFVDSGDPMSPDMYGIPLPHVLFAKLLPGFERMMHPYRFVLLACFALALGAGWAVRGRPALALGVVALHVGEHTFATNGLVPFRPSTIELPQGLLELPETPGCPAVAFTPRLKTYKTIDFRHVSEIEELPEVQWDDWVQVEVVKEASWKDGLEWDRLALYLQMTAWERPLADHVPLAVERGSGRDLEQLSDAGVGVVVLVEDLVALGAELGGGIPMNAENAINEWPHRASGIRKALEKGGATLVTRDELFEVWTLPGCGA